MQPSSLKQFHRGRGSAANRPNGTFWGYPGIPADLPAIRRCPGGKRRRAALRRFCEAL